jgi:fructose-bisphosphate aldolase, class I
VHEGRQRRFGRILTPPSGRGIVVAFDHGLFLGPAPGVEEIRPAVARVVAGGPDAVQVSPGVAAAIIGALTGPHAPALVLRVDASNTWRTVAQPAVPYRVRVATVEDAVRLGADAIVAFLFAGYADDWQEGANLADIGALASECRRWGMPLVVEPLQIALGKHLVNDPDTVALMVRMACEAGADLIKADYTGSPESFARVIRGSTVPVLVRGGPKMDTPEQVLRMAADALSVGAQGVVFGRNIWQHSDPAGMVRALRRVVHERAAPADALAEMTAGSGVPSTSLGAGRGQGGPRA